MSARDPRHDCLFEPLQIGPKRMKNRFYQVPYSTGFGMEQPHGEAVYRALRAEGGWAVVHTDICSVHPECDLRGYAADGRLWDEADVRSLAQVTDRIHEHDALAGVELYYGGAFGFNDWTRVPARGVSATVSELTAWSHSCYEMTGAEVRELEGFYVAAAKRARSAGFDIINLCANSQMNIVQQFLMGFYNRRTDEYGGSLENRTRFLRETLEQIRAAVGDDCALTVRMTVETFSEGERGLRAGEESAQIVSLCDDLVDFWDLDVGGMSSAHGTAKWGVGSAPSRFRESAWEEEWIEQVRPHTDKPIVGVGRFTDPDVMVGAITRGPLDAIGAARPSISDPFLPRKIEEGRADEIRECIGCNVCIMRFARHVPVNCTQNPTAGEEHRRAWHPERFDAARDTDLGVLVVGAGPAGMECATVLGHRGLRDVHLVEADRRPGGSMSWIPRLPGLGIWSRVVEYRTTQIDKLRNVVLIPNKRLAADEVLDYGANIVAIATGSHWALDGTNPMTQGPIPGADANLPNVLTPEQIMVESKSVVGNRVLVYDCESYFMGVSIAEKLALDGHDVTLATPTAGPGLATFYTEEGPDIVRRLVELDVTLATDTVIESLADGVAQARSELMPEARSTLEYDSIVLVTQRIADDALFRELQGRADEVEAAGIRGLYRVGDCVAPRLVADAIFDGHRLAREIDSDDPREPLPFRIEVPALLTPRA